MNDFPYTDKSCNTQPNSQLKAKAEKFKLRGYNRLTLKDNNYKIDMEAIKQNLSQGAPFVVIGMAVGGSFNSVGKNGLWAPTKQDYTNVKKSLDGHIVDDGGGGSFGGHAMCVVGFDDDYEGGAFQIMNSWGNTWGADGLFWMRYKDFEYFVNTFYGEAYGLYPLAKQQRDNANETDFQMRHWTLRQRNQSTSPSKARVVMSLKQKMYFLKVLNSKSLSRMKLNVMCMYLGKKLMAAAMYYSLIPKNTHLLRAS